MAYKVLAVLRAKVSPSLWLTPPPGPGRGTLTGDVQVGPVGALVGVAVVQQTLIQTGITQLDRLQHHGVTRGCAHDF